MAEKRRRYTRCSFCGKGQDQVRRLVAGPGVYICDQCIELSQEVLDLEAPTKSISEPPHRSKPPIRTGTVPRLRRRRRVLVPAGALFAGLLIGWGMAQLDSVTTSRISRR